MSRRADPSLDRHCIRELNRTLAKTLCRAGRIWAPLKLPVDRIVVGAGFPAEGRADIYEDFVGLVGEGITAKGDPPPTRLIVISLGLRSGERDLEPSEVSGALAVQVQRLVDDIYSKHRAVATPAVDTGPAAVTQGDSPPVPRTSRLSRSTPALEPRRGVATQRRRSTASPQAQQFSRRVILCQAETRADLSARLAHAPIRTLRDLHLH